MSGPRRARTALFERVRTSGRGRKHVENLNFSKRPKWEDNDHDQDLSHQMREADAVRSMRVGRLPQRKMSMKSTANATIMALTAKYVCKV